MARKRIKTLAHEWAVPVEEVLASSARLRLGHTLIRNRACSLRKKPIGIKADLDEQAHRTALLRRETVVETSAGRSSRSGSTPTVMRRRHAETGPGSRAAGRSLSILSSTESRRHFRRAVYRRTARADNRNSGHVRYRTRAAANAGAAAEAPAEEVGAMADEHAPEDDSVAITRADYEGRRSCADARPGSSRACPNLRPESSRLALR